MKKRTEYSAGLSLLEILVVVAVFAILAVLTTRAVLLTLRGSKKSESTARVRENIDYSLAVMERNLRNAESIDCSTPNVISYFDENRSPGSFSYQPPDVNHDEGYIASGSGRLTSSEVDVTTCNFTCDNTTVPPSVTISIEAQDANVSGLERGQITASTKIYLRSYY